jgi:hypothetical protein
MLVLTAALRAIGGRRSAGRLVRGRGRRGRVSVRGSPVQVAPEPCLRSNTAIPRVKSSSWE